MNKTLLINGPNLNLLGTREPELYGHITLSELEQKLQTMATSLDITLTCIQSNAEHDIVNTLQSSKTEEYQAIIINPAAYSHTSIAIRDTLIAIELPCIEVHISNIYAREAFRKQSLISDIASGSIVGLGTYGYELALRAIHHQLNNN